MAVKKRPTVFLSRIVRMVDKRGNVTFTFTDAPCDTAYPHAALRW